MKEDSLPQQKQHSVPDDIDALVKSVHDNLVGAGSASPVVTAPAQIAETEKAQPPVQDNQSAKADVTPFDDLLDDLAASDRQTPDKQKQYANESIIKVEEYKDDM